MSHEASSSLMLLQNFFVEFRVFIWRRKKRRNSSRGIKSCAAKKKECAIKQKRVVVVVVVDTRRENHHESVVHEHDMVHRLLWRGLSLLRGWDHHVEQIHFERHAVPFSNRLVLLGRRVRMDHDGTFIQIWRHRVRKR